MNQKSVGVRGRPVNKQCEVDMLDKEAKEMERNLKNLQARMQQQSIEDEAVPKFGGSRWKSARPDKGTVKSYTKDIQDKHRQKSSAEIPSQGSQSVPQVARQKEVCPSDFRGRDVHDWSVADVFDWLISAQLCEYSTSFKANEINGSLLIDIALDDLDYLGVKKLGHRKIILRSIEDLRKNGRITLHLIASNEGDAESKTTASTSSSQNSEVMAARKEKETVHWSHLEPLSLNKVSNPEQCINSTDVNAADNTSDFLDEAAERAAFQEAVASWRNSGPRNEVEVEVQGKGESCNTSTKKKVDKNSDSGMWHNPFMSMTDELEDSVSKESVKTKHENKCDQGLMTNYSTESDRTYTVSTEVKNFFFQGSLDEVAEHEEFVNAVNAWRNRGSAVPSKVSPQGTTIISSKIPLGTASNTALALAAKLSIELEDEEKQLKLFINEKRNLLQASRIQNEDIKIEQSENKNGNSSSMVLEEEFNDYNDFQEFDSQEKYHLSSSNSIYDKIFTGKEENKKINDDIVMPSCDTKKGEEKVPQGMTYRGGINVSLKGSFLGLPDPAKQLQDEAAYHVDEGSDDD